MEKELKKLYKAFLKARKNKEVRKATQEAFNIIKTLLIKEDL